jgi:hypothetical protein
MFKRDYIYYAYRLEKKKPKKLYWKLYCCLRKIITIKESSSKIIAYYLSKKL